MKKYVQPEMKCRRSSFEPYAMEIHSSQGDGEQLGNEVLFDKDEKDPIF